MSNGDLRLAALGPTGGDQSAILFADAPAVRRLSSALRGLEGDAWTTQLANPPATDQTQLGRLRLRVSESLLRIELTDGVLEISGAPVHLHRLADELDLYVEYNDLDEPGMHAHVDMNWTPKPTWLGADSIPLMVAGWVPEPD
jgi:hypothetical protein